MTHVLVLAGGPDAEHDVSLDSAGAIAEALMGVPDMSVELRAFRDPAELSFESADVVIPALHGPWGEGGGAQRMLDDAGVSYVGSGAQAAALAMDKLLTKRLARRLGIATPEAVEIDPAAGTLPMPCPFVVKPIAEGSSVGLYVVRSASDWARASEAIGADHTPGRRWMAEAFVGGSAGRELTVPLLEREGRLSALPIIEIAPAEGLYDYESKYQRSDTVYTVDPELPADTRRSLVAGAERLAQEIGVRHLARVDYRLDDAARPGLLEINTFPGFTATSLLPKAALKVGMGMVELCQHLVRLAGVGQRCPEARA